MGTSLVVQPANQLPIICLNRGVPIVIINKDSNTKYDTHADLLVDRPSGETMKEVMEKLKQNS